MPSDVQHICKAVIWTRDGFHIAGVAITILLLTALTNAGGFTLFRATLRLILLFIENVHIGLRFVGTATH